MGIKPTRMNYGMALLRMLMCFEVILCHFWTSSASGILVPFSRLKGLAVPVFMFLAFYFTKQTYLTSDDQTRIKRIRRLSYPQIVWAIVYWLFFLILQRSVGIKDLLWQILTGHCRRLNPTMWFQSVLIALSFLFFLVFRLLSDKKGLVLLFTITLFSLWFQYSGFNSRIFSHLRYELKYPLGRLFEMIPYATLGFSIAYYNVFERLNKNRIVYLVLFGIMSALFVLYSRVVPKAPGFGYSNGVNLLTVFFITGFAYLLPFDKVPPKIQAILLFITKYTLGIYCMHRLIGVSLKHVLIGSGLEINGFLLSILIYLFAFVASFIIAKISPNNLRQVVE